MFVSTVPCSIFVKFSCNDIVNVPLRTNLSGTSSQGNSILRGFVDVQKIVFGSHMVLWVL